MCDSYHIVVIRLVIALVIIRTEETLGSVHEHIVPF